ncbi:MAG TPA: SRPBCC domain-containing protein [Bacteriovoracaceae bacterium]|nr:SRPBCC domain-containing protein [Bacteriovoracaceae bacterium]
MSYDLNFSRIIQAPRPEVFNYFTDATLLESWCYPDGMSLKVPFFENNLHGQYRYEHQDISGKLYVCTGYIEGYESDRRLLTVDHVETGEGEVIFDELISDIIFSEDAGGCKIEVRQKGFKSEEEAQDCLKGWDQCLNRLDRLFEELLGLNNPM